MEDVYGHCAVRCLLAVTFKSRDHNVAAMSVYSLKSAFLISRNSIYATMITKVFVCL